MTTYEIRRVPGGDRWAMPRRMATIDAACERDALEAYKASVDAKGWHDMCDPGGLEWRNRDYAGAWNADDERGDVRSREWRLLLQYRDQHTTAFVAWRA
jgi:hypothetical protein